MTSEPARSQVRERATGTHGTLLATSGAIVGSLAFFVTSFLSLWGLLSAGSIYSLLGSMVVGTALAVVVLRSGTAFATALASAMLVLTGVGYLVGIESAVVVSVSVEPAALLRHGGHSVTVWLATAVMLGAALLRHAPKRTPR